MPTHCQNQTHTVLQATREQLPKQTVFRTHETPQDKHNWLLDESISETPRTQTTEALVTIRRPLRGSTTRVANTALRKVHQQGEGGGDGNEEMRHKTDNTKKAR